MMMIKALERYLNLRHVAELWVCPPSPEDRGLWSVVATMSTTGPDEDDGVQYPEYRTLAYLQEESSARKYLDILVTNIAAGVPLAPIELSDSAGRPVDIRYTN